jgi:DNA-directed RNA polymerase specialized sigma24 family protein
MRMDFVCVTRPRVRAAVREVRLRDATSERRAPRAFTPQPTSHSADRPFFFFLVSESGEPATTKKRMETPPSDPAAWLEHEALRFSEELGLRLDAHEAYDFAARAWEIATTVCSGEACQSPYDVVPEMLRRNLLHRFARTLLRAKGWSELKERDRKQLEDHYIPECVRPALSHTARECGLTDEDVNVALSEGKERHKAGQSFVVVCRRLLHATGFPDEPAALKEPGWKTNPTFKRWFNDEFRGALLKKARALGCPERWVEDEVEDTLAEVVVRYRHDRENASFRGLAYIILRRRLVRLLRRSQKEVLNSPPPNADPDAPNPDDLIEDHRPPDPESLEDLLRIWAAASPRQWALLAVMGVGEVDPLQLARLLVDCVFDGARVRATYALPGSDLPTRVASYFPERNDAPRLLWLIAAECGSTTVELLDLFHVSTMPGVVVLARDLATTPVTLLAGVTAMGRPQLDAMGAVGELRARASNAPRIAVSGKKIPMGETWRRLYPKRDSTSERTRREDLVETLAGALRKALFDARKAARAALRSKIRHGRRP